MTAGAASEEVAASFDPLRPKLIRVAYRMLGSVADAEDVVQEAFVRWMGTDRASVREPEAFLRRTVTRLCLDVLKSARRRRETYLGPWLPEPVVEEDADDDVTLPLLLALERLSPLERAAFLLHDVFGVSFEEVAATIGRDATATSCRQLASRARAHIRETRPRFKVEKQRGLALAQAFFTASRSGDTASLRAMLADDVSVYADGGGKRRATTRPIHGIDPVMKLHEGLAQFYVGSTLVQTAFVNGLPGFISREADGELQTTAFEIEDGKIAAIYVVRNPEKLRHLHS